MKKFETRILKLDQKLINAKTVPEQNNITKEIRKTEEFLLNEYEDKVKAACFRSKAQYFLYGEKNSKYFFNLEKSRGNAKIISQLVREDGSIINNPKKILAEKKWFYQKLYGHKSVKEWNYTNDTDNKLSDQERDSLDREISDMELSNSLMSMANHKSPGFDGITAEFYKCFWIHLKDLFGIVVREIMSVN